MKVNTVIGQLLLYFFSLLFCPHREKTTLWQVLLDMLNFLFPRIGLAVSALTLLLHFLFPPVNNSEYLPPAGPSDAILAAGVFPTFTIDPASATRVDETRTREMATAAREQARVTEVASDAVRVMRDIRQQIVPVFLTAPTSSRPSTTVRHTTNIVVGLPPGGSATIPPPATTAPSTPAPHPPTSAPALANNKVAVGATQPTTLNRTAPALPRATNRIATPQPSRPNRGVRTPPANPMNRLNPNRTAVPAAARTVRQTPVRANTTGIGSRPNRVNHHRATQAVSPRPRNTQVQRQVRPAAPRPQIRPAQRTLRSSASRSSGPVRRRAR